eukprot:6016780-Alexandrium_andersonii.AAC.2
MINLLYLLCLRAGRSGGRLRVQFGALDEMIEHKTKRLERVIQGEHVGTTGTSKFDVAGHVASSRGGSAPPPPDPPEKRLRRAHRPVSSSPSDSAREMTPNPPDEAS